MSIPGEIIIIIGVVVVVAINIIAAVISINIAIIVISINIVVVVISVRIGVSSSFSLRLRGEMGLGLDLNEKDFASLSFGGDECQKRELPDSRLESLRVAARAQLFS